MPTSWRWKFSLCCLLGWFLLALALDRSFVSLSVQSGNSGGSADFQDAARNFRLLLWTGSALLTLLAAFPFWWYRRRLEQRLREVREFTGSMAAGSFRPIPLEREWSELAAIIASLNELGSLHENSIRLLTEERNRSDAILRSMVEGVAVIEPGQKIVFCNEAFCRALGLAEVPCAGRLLVEVTRQSGLLDLFQQALASQQTVSGETESGTSPAKIFSVTAAPVLTGAGHAVVLVLHDITELRRLERTRRDFVANVSHEFKTPLTAIQGFAETLLAGALNDQENSVRFLRIIRDHAVRLGRVTNDLLKLSLIEAGKLQLNLRPVAIPDLVQTCIDTVRLKAEDRRLRLTTQCSSDLPPVAGDASRLREALLNLLDNALQYTPSGGRINVRAYLQGSGVVIAVEDTGIGIPQAEQKRIFERFYRVDDARSKEAGGTGLGLSITKHLVEAHGGRIQLTSQVGQGTTFSIHLPVSTS